ncbi:hypothetical protein Tco_1335786 [Tanacetum coccineum]
MSKSRGGGGGVNHVPQKKKSDLAVYSEDSKELICFAPQKGSLRKWTKLDVILGGSSRIISRVMCEKYAEKTKEVLEVDITREQPWSANPTHSKDERLERGQVVNQRVVTCFRVWKDKDTSEGDCPKLKESKRRNKAGNKNGVGEVKRESICARWKLRIFDAIIGMEWLANHHAAIVCDEKVVRIPYGDEVLIVQGDGGGRSEIVGGEAILNMVVRLYRDFFGRSFSEDLLDYLAIRDKLNFEIDLVPGATRGACAARDRYNIVTKLRMNLDLSDNSWIDSLVDRRLRNPIYKRLLDAQVEAMKEEIYGTKDFMWY